MRSTRSRRAPARPATLVTLSDYANDEARPKPRGEVVALVRITGAIMSGSPSRGPLDDDNVATAEDVVDALDQAARAKEVKAIVLRIDSPGGTYPAADAIADAVGRARSAGKPVIVSMGDVAASGGYLAALRADVIVAQPTTITASIGVFGVWPVATGAAGLARRQRRAPVGRHQCRHVLGVPAADARRSAPRSRASSTRSTPISRARSARRASSRAAASTRRRAAASSPASTPRRPA